MIDFSLKSTHWSSLSRSPCTWLCLASGSFWSISSTWEYPYSSYKTVHQPYGIWVWLTALKVSEILAFLLDICLPSIHLDLINGWSSVMNPQPEERKHCWSTSCFNPHVAALDNSHSGLFGHFHQWIAWRKKMVRNPPYCIGKSWKVNGFL